MNRTSDPDADARTALRLIGPDPANWVPDRPASTTTSPSSAADRPVARLPSHCAVPGSARSPCWSGARRTARRHLAQRRADEPAAHAEDAARTGTRHPGVQLPGLVRGAPRPGGLCRHRPDQAHGLGGLPQLVQAVSRHQAAIPDARGPDRTARGDHFRLHLGTPTGARGRDRPKDHSRDRFAGSGGSVHSGRADRAPAAHPLRTYRGRNRLRCPARQDRRCDRRRRRPPSMRPAWRWSMAPPRCICSPVATHRGRYRSPGRVVFPGAYDNYHQLPDADRWHQAIRFFRAGSTPRPMRSSALSNSRTSICIFLRRGPTRRNATAGRDDGQRHDVPARFRHRRHRIFRRSRIAAGTARLRRPDPALARPLHAAAG